MSRFVDNFWVTDFTSTHGYDVIIKRLKEGKQMLKDLEEFLNKRAKVEDTYGKSLIRLSRNSGGKDEIGSLKRSWDQYVVQTEKVGEAHVAMSSVLQDQAKKVHEFRDRQNEKRKKIEDVVTDSQKKKKDHYNDVMRCKKAYEKSCREADQAEDVALKSRFTVEQKQLEKLNNKRDKAKLQSEQADSAYHRSVEHLEDARQRWEKEFAQGCVVFQALEEERIRFLRNELWIQTNIGSAYCCKDDNMYEDVRKVLEMCDENKDLDHFIAEKGTGSNKPAQIHYANYYETKINARSTTREGSIMSKSRQMSATSRRPPEPLPLPSNSQTIGPGRQTHNIAIPRGTLPAVPGRNTTHQRLIDTEIEDDPAYAAVNEINHHKLVMASFDYEAQGNREISFKKGDIIRVSDSSDENWWEGMCNGRRGMFPATYVEEAPPDSTLL
ncbi:proline-serine-threonine phosphatase-interacting protein 2-like isoform X2 [Glandiceps talaboti]